MNTGTFAAQSSYLCVCVFAQVALQVPYVEYSSAL